MREIHENSQAPPSMPLLLSPLYSPLNTTQSSPQLALASPLCHFSLMAQPRRIHSTFDNSNPQCLTQRTPTYPRHLYANIYGNDVTKTEANITLCTSSTLASLV